MDILEKVRILGDAGKYDVCASSASKRVENTNDRVGNAAAAGICHSFTPDGRCVSLFKMLYTNRCGFDCNYCGNRCNGNGNHQHTAFTPTELADVFMKLYLSNYVEGLFLSSGIGKDPDTTQAEIIECVRLLRDVHKYRGYIHLKILPGVSYELVKQTAELSDRLSINLEASSQSRLSDISSTKDYKNDILKRQSWIKGFEKKGLATSGQTTQFIVGASDETDLEILGMLDWEYKNMQLKRGYFSAFSPIPDTPLMHHAQTPMMRKHRLYQTDWLLRVYKFPLSDIKMITNDGFLPPEDPKLVLAQETFDGALDINEAGYNELIRVPGIGPVSAQRILNLRRSRQSISKKAELQNMGVVVKRALPFIKIGGYSQGTLNQWV